jgi:hypothetical protein
MQMEGGSVDGPSNSRSSRLIDQHMRPADQLWNSFARINASDEMYFPTALAVLGIQRKRTIVLRPQVAKRAVTYTDWTEGMRNPATLYTNGIRETFKELP